MQISDAYKRSLGKLQSLDNEIAKLESHRLMLLLVTIRKHKKTEHQVNEALEQLAKEVKNDRL